MRTRPAFAQRSLLFALLLLAAAGCETIVYQDRPLFPDPGAAAGGFVGYGNVQSKVTVCGNCHSTHQRQWVQTAHADAWGGLAASGASQAFCEGCHTVNALGNTANMEAGWLASRDPRYHDVQCESCHGPGLTHVRAPTRANWPLAPIAVGADLTQGCGQCHSGAHHPYVADWSRSKHATIPSAVAASGRAECRGCHTGEDALVQWGVRAEFLEKQTHVANPAQNLGIACAVCHDPHNNEIPGQLRFSVTVPSEEENLCMKCHQKRGNPDPATFRGPHSPEGPTLLGFAGSWMGTMDFGDRIATTHGTERNPGLCAGCHVNQYTATDPETGGHLFTSTGHTFEATPCVDGDGRPIEGPCPKEQRTYQTCAAAGCHANAAQGRELEIRAEERMVRLTDELGALLQQVHRAGGRTDNWWQCRASGNCPGSPLHFVAGQWTIAQGAAFNYELVRFSTGERAGQLRPGQATHNPVLLEVLLITTVREVRREYAIPAQTAVSLARQFGTTAQADGR